MRRPASVPSVLAIPVLGGHLLGCFPDPKLLDALDTSVSVEDAQPPTDVTPTRDGLACTGDGECSALAGPCVTATCENGICETAELDDVPCDDGLACTTDDLCTAGSCVGQVRVCEAPGQCEQAGACDPSSGECVYPRATNGTPCDDGDRCTAGDACLDGVCRSTRTPDDSLGDWVQLFTGTTSAQLAGIEVVSAGVAVLVNFQVDEFGNRSLRLDGLHEVIIPDESTEATALFLVRLDGRSVAAVLLAHGNGMVRGEYLDALADGRLIVTGLGNGSVQRGPGGTTLELGPEPGARMFGLKVSTEAQADPEFWIATPTSQEGTGGVRAFVAAGDDCIAMVPVTNNTQVTLSNARGQVAATEGDEDAFAGSWVVWLPGCGTVVGVQRYLRPSSQGGLMVSAVDGDEDGNVVLGGFTTAGLSFSSPGGAVEPVIDRPGGSSFVLSLDAARTTTFFETVTDGPNGIALPWDTRIRGPQLAYSLDVTGKTMVEDSLGSLSSLPGDPENDADVRPRAVLLRRNLAQGAMWLRTLSFFDYSGKTGSALGALAVSESGRVMTIPSFGGGGGIGEDALGILQLRAFSGSGETLWEWRPFRDSSDLSMVGPNRIRAVPGSESIVAGGTVSGVGRIMVSETLGRDVDTGESEEASAIWLLRLNSDDGVGCR